MAQTYAEYACWLHFLNSNISIPLFFDKKLFKRLQRLINKEVKCTFGSKLFLKKKL